MREAKTTAFYKANPTRLKEDVGDILSAYTTREHRVLFSYIEILREELEHARRVIKSAYQAVHLD